VIEERPLPAKPPNAFAIFRDRVKEIVKIELIARQVETGGDEVRYLLYNHKFVEKEI